MTSAVKSNYGEGGAGLSTSNALHPPIANILRDLIDDVAGAGGTPAVITSADASDLATAITLVNEIKAALNAVPQQAAPLATKA